MAKHLSGNEIRKQFIEFFVEKKKHKFVPSSSLVPAGDATLLFANSGMVQFKDVFLGIDKRDYVRAVNSQKCMRVAGKHNDLKDVGFDHTHHTFFEMLGNWSFGDYYKKEAIDWAWELLTEVWDLPKENLYVTVFKDELDEIPTDEEAAGHWASQPGMSDDRIVFLGRKDNFWEMADVGPCGPNSEIIIDQGADFGEITYLEDGQVDLDGPRFVELWNLVFIQYNRTDPKSLEPLPSKHVDTGMGFDRIVSILQKKSSNYRTDLFWPILQEIQKIAGHSDDEREENFTPYRVIADHARASTFLIADGVVPGNLGRNYVTRMVIRRAARFGTKIGLENPFLAKIAKIIIDEYGEAYPELKKNQDLILSNLTLEEERFQRTVEKGIIQLEEFIAGLKESNNKILDGKTSFDLYATYGLPLEITQDILQEQGFSVDEVGFQETMEIHRAASGGGKAMGEMGAEEAEYYHDLLGELIKNGKLNNGGVEYLPYQDLEIESKIISISKDGKEAKQVNEGDKVAVILASTNFYSASGGQISDTGIISSKNNPKWNIQVEDITRPIAGIIVHHGTVVRGKPKNGDTAIAKVDPIRRQDIMRNHTATHLLHAELHKVLGNQALQAGSLVAPDRLRFDFTNSDPVTQNQLDEIEAGVNQNILDNFAVKIEQKSLEKAKAEGAIALFGEKYSEDVRTVQIGNGNPFSYELCGGTHVKSTSEIGTFLIVSEGSAAAGIRRIEAITGRKAYETIRNRFAHLQQTAIVLKTNPNELFSRAEYIVDELEGTIKDLAHLRQEMASGIFDIEMQNPNTIAGVSVLAVNLPGADRDTLRQMADRFRQKTSSGIAVIASIVEDKPAIVATITDDLVKKGLDAGNLVNFISEPLGGKGGGRPNMAQAGGKHPEKLEKALSLVNDWAKDNLK